MVSGHSVLMAGSDGGCECWYIRGFIREFLHGFNRELRKRVQGVDYDRFSPHSPHLFLNEKPEKPLMSKGEITLKYCPSRVFRVP